MRTACLLLLLAVLPITSGCALFGKKEGSSERSAPFAWFKKKEPASNALPPPKFPSTDPLVNPAGTPPPAPTPQPTASTDSATLAGHVVDGYNRSMSNTYIRVVNLDASKDSAKEVDIATLAGGYFTIPNLKPGGQYQLIARTKQGEKLLAGIAVAMAPNTAILIQVKEELATSSIPPIPATAVAPPSDEKKETKPAETSQIPVNGAGATGWSPSVGGANTAIAGNDVDLPAKLTIPSPLVVTPDKSWPPPLQIGGTKKPATNVKPPTTALPASAPTTPLPPALAPSTDLQGALAPLVPSCVLVSDYLQTLALNDLDGQTWNFHKDRKGKLVLIDFWTRNCLPCEKSMPVLSQLQNKFGPQGLEIVGITIDNGAVKDQAARAKMLCYRLQTNYRQVLGQNDRTNICGQFGVQAFPTLILLDDTGRILWRHVAAPDQATLEQVIQKHLAARGF